MTEQYKVVVRSYKRPEQVVTHTLGLLSRQSGNLLQRTFLLVADSSEYDAYRKSIENSDLDFPVSNIVVTCPGASATLNHFFYSCTSGERLFIMDDDIKALYEYPEDCDQKSIREILNLDKYIEYGFELIDTYDLGAFSFNYANPFFKKGHPFVKVGMHHIPGAFWGCRVNQSIFTDYAHEDDNVRTAQMLEKYSRTAIFDWIGVKMAPIGTNPGGLQTDNNRNDTKAICEQAYRDIPVIRKYFKEELGFNEKYGFHSLRFKGKNELKKLPNRKDDLKIQKYFGPILPEEEKVTLFTFD